MSFSVISLLPFAIECLKLTRIRTVLINYIGQLVYAKKLSIQRVK